MTQRDMLQREVEILEAVIRQNESVLASKTMSEDDREALERQMAIRITHRNVLRKQLDHHPSNASSALRLV